MATVRRLAEEFPRVIGIKDSTGDISHMIRLIAAVKPVRPDFLFLTGWDAALVPMLLVGCDGGTNATSGVLPELMRAVYDAVKAGDLARANALQLRVTAVFDPLLQGADFPEGVRVGVGLRGFRMGPSRQPATSAQVAERETLAERLRGLLGDCGVRAEEPEACTAPGGSRGIAPPGAPSPRFR